ncbi:MAG TPA: AtpZ/AtpI family protein [Gemmatimonadaceae bacterium]|nr:AtpZ/AtpI family protein [Gemmatimonadaceae bacterium]
MGEDRRRAPDGRQRPGHERGGLAATSTLAAAGIEFALLIVIFLYLGRWLDARMGTAPVLMIVGVFIGAAGGMYRLYRSLMTGQNDHGGRGSR